MWTLILVLIVLGLACDRWSASLRCPGAAHEAGEPGLLREGTASPSAARPRPLLAAALLLSVASVPGLRLDLARLLSPETWRRAGRLIAGRASAHPAVHLG